MARHTYTAEQLHHLRASPLVRKPDALPSIDQWIDPPQEREVAQRKPARAQNGRSADDSGPMGNFGSQRPSLLQTRQSKASADDVVLGPPKTSFASSRNIRRGEDGDDKAFQAGQDGDDFSLEAISARTRNYNDDDGNRRRGFGGEDRDKDGWTTARKGRAYESRPIDKERQFGRGMREPRDRQAGPGDDENRRNGFNARDEPRWAVKDSEDRRQAARTPAREGGWRDRERRPERDYGRDAPAERAPEWMDEPGFDEGPAARTAAEFEKWKAKMKGQKAEEPKEVELPQSEKSPSLPKLSTTLFADQSFGTWGEAKKQEASARPEPTPTTPATSKKSSRFASMFAPKDEAPPPLPGLAQGGPLPAAIAAAPSADQEAFQRMLLKLRSASVNSPQDEGAATRQAGQAPPPGFGPPSGGDPNHRASPNPLIQSILASKSDSRPGSTIDSTSGRGHGTVPSGPQAHPPHSRQQSHKLPPSKEIPKSESPALNALLGAQQSSERKTPALSKDSEFLLNLIQMKSANRPPQTSQQESESNFQLFLDQPPRPQQMHGPPQPQRNAQPPSGPMHQPPEHPFPQGPGRNGNDGQERRQPSNPPPPGFFDGPPDLQQRRPPGFGPPPPEFFHHDPHRPPPPGFMGGMMHQMHHPNNPHAGPPGLPGMPGMPGMFSSPPPPPPPHMMQHHQQQQGQQQQRGPPGLAGPPDHPFPPGIAPPPGFGQGFMSPPGFGGPHMPPHPPGIGRAMPPGPGGPLGGQGQESRNGVGRGR